MPVDIDARLREVRPLRQHQIRDGERRAQEIARRAAVRDRLAPLAEYQNDPVGFVETFLPRFQLAPYQAEGLEALAEHGRVALKGPRGLGKTGVTSVAALWFVLVYEAMQADWKMILTAGQWSQIAAYLFPEIHKWARLLEWGKLGMDEWRKDRELLRTAIQLEYGAATSASPTRADLIEGAHAAAVTDRDGEVVRMGAVMVVFDESKMISRATFDAIEGVFSNIDRTGTFGYALAVSTPGAPVGKFYDIHRRAAGTEDWWVRSVTLQEAITAGRVTREWADRLGRMWGVESSLFKNHVLGEFAADDESSVIPTSFVEQAQTRRDALLAEPGFVMPIGTPPTVTAPTPPPGAQARGPRLSGVRFGLDIARHGKDKTILVCIVDDLVTEIIELPSQDLAKTATDVAGHVRRYGGGRIVVDADGMGAGVADQLKASGFDVFPFFGGVHVDWWRDRTGMLKAKNRRSAAWWHLRELLDPNLGASLMLPRHDMLLGDITSPQRLSTAHLSAGAGNDLGVIAIEPKENTKKRLGRSPDYGDALCYAVWLVEPSEKVWVPDEEWMEGRTPDEFTPPEGVVAGAGPKAAEQDVTGQGSWTAEDGWY